LMNPARLILGCRSVEKGQQALKSIRQTTNYKGGEVWAIDLTDFSSVSAFADRYGQEGGGRLDILVENAGIVTHVYRETRDGWESTLQTNHLGTALLAFLLLPHLTKSPAPRSVIVTSEVHFWTALAPAELEAPKILEKLNDKGHCATVGLDKRYGDTKLMNIFFMRALSSHLSPTSPLTVNAVNPGLCRTDIGREITSWGYYLLVLLLGRSAELGGRTLVHAAVGDVAEGGMHGVYLSNCAVRETSDFVLSKEGRNVEERIWAETIDILSAVDSRVPAIVSQYLNNVPTNRIY